MSVAVGVAKVGKAVVGALVAGLGALTTALSDGSVTASEWVTVALATVVAAGGVWGVPNLAKDVKDE